KTILNRWNFPDIPNGRIFSRLALMRLHATIYDLATDSGVFLGYPAALAETLQHARELGEDLLQSPTAADGSGPIYFFQIGLVAGWCRDAADADVNLLRKTAEFGNEYFSPSANPNGWT